MLYNMYEMLHASLSPLKFSAIATRMTLQNPYNPLSYTRGGRTMAAMAELVERATKRFGKPAFGLDHTIIDGKRVGITEHIVDEKPFCNLINFHRSCKRNDPKVLIVAPLSGHFATLLRGTVEGLLPHHNVYITDWMDARQVPMADGKFDLDDCISYIRDFIRLLGPDCHVIAVCQPAVPVLAAVSVMALQNDPKQPATMTLMGGPIDPRVSKTQVTELAEQRPLEWFENTVVSTVPTYYPGALRKVYPGFVQLGGFMSMNLDRHIGKHFDFYNHLVQGDGDSAEKHRVFYDEYLAVMDLTAEFYLQTVETVFQKHSLPLGEMIWTDPSDGQEYPVLPSKIKKTALLTVEGELDDISATGQTEATHTLCSSLAASKKFHHMQEKVGHYGIFNGRRWREHIMPRLRHFVRKHSLSPKSLSPLPAKDLDMIADKAPKKWSGEPKTSTGKPAAAAKKAATAKKAPSKTKPKAKKAATKPSAAKKKATPTKPKAAVSKKTTTAKKADAAKKKKTSTAKSTKTSKTSKSAASKKKTTKAKAGDNKKTKTPSHLKLVSNN